MTPANGRARKSPQSQTTAPLPLCTETQGRQIVAAMLNDAVEEALGLALTGGSGGQGREPAPGATQKPAAKQ